MMSPEQRRAHYQKNKAKIREQQKNWYNSNKAKVRATQKEYNRSRREENREYHRKWCQENKDRIQNSRLKKYGITLDEYNAIFSRQNGLCKICEQLPTGRNGRSGKLDVDHCHKTGKVRGLLCTECNTGLGKMKEDPKILAKAILYLEGN